MNQFKVPFHQPYINFDPEMLEKIREVVRIGWVSIGRYVAELEKLFKNRFKVKHAIATNNCTNGLIIAIKAAGWENRNIAVPAFTWPSTPYAVACGGNRVYYEDIDPDTWLINDSVVYQDHRYQGIVAVDVFGNQAQVPETNIPVIYDAAHGWDLPNLGHRGIAEVVSLSHTKIVTAMEGGMILTNNSEIAEHCLELRRLSSRMGEINALVGLYSVRIYDTEIKLFRESTIETYENHLKAPHVRQSIPRATNDSVYSILIESTELRDKIAKSLRENGIECKVYYDPLANLPETNKVYSRIISLPVCPMMSNEQDRIIEIINGCLN